MAIDLDPIERLMDKPVTQMGPAELVSYVKTYQREVHGIDMPTDELIDRKIMEAFINRYPEGMAGKIVQHLMLVHQGRKGSSLVTPTVFSKGMKWWTDTLYMEVQERDKREQRVERTNTEVKGRFFDLGNL